MMQQRCRLADHPVALNTFLFVFCPYVSPLSYRLLPASTCGVNCSTTSCCQAATHRRQLLLLLGVLLKTWLPLLSTCGRLSSSSWQAHLRHRCVQGQFEVPFEGYQKRTQARTGTLACC